MSRTTDFLMSIRWIIKLHESMLKEICQEYQLTLVEATIISFLHNNPGKDTAADIVEFRMLSKGSVSQAVENLIQKSILQRKQDTVDRRKIHLSLTKTASPITESMETVWNKFHKEIFSGLSQEDQKLFERVNKQIIQNAKVAMARREQA